MLSTPGSSPRYLGSLGGILIPSSLRIETTIGPSVDTSSLQATPAHRISLAVAQTRSFLTEWTVVPRAQQGLIAYHGPLGVPNLTLSERLSLDPLAHLPQLVEIPPIPYKKRDNSRVVRSLGALARCSPQSTCPF